MLFHDPYEDEDTISGPPVGELDEAEKALVARAKAEHLDLTNLCRDPWGELWLEGVPLWACLGPDDEIEAS